MFPQEDSRDPQSRSVTPPGSMPASFRGPEDLRAGSSDSAAPSVAGGAVNLPEDSMQPGVDEPTTSDRKPVIYPGEMKEYLDRHIIGNEEPKKVLAVAAYRHQLRIRYVPGYQMVNRILKKHFDRGDSFDEKKVDQLHSAITATLRSNPISRRRDSIARKDICRLLEQYEKEGILELKSESLPLSTGSAKKKSAGRRSGSAAASNSPQSLSGKYSKVIDDFIKDKKEGEQKFKQGGLVLEGSRSVPLLIGQTGSGKSHLVRVMADRLKLPSVYIDAASLAEASYTGLQASDIASLLLNSAKQMLPRGSSKIAQVRLASSGIVFLDELDKKAQLGAGSESSRGGAQAGLLATLDGFVDSNTGVDLRTCLFVAAGSFSGSVSGGRDHTDPSKMRIIEIVARRLNLRGFGFKANRAEEAGSTDVSPQALVSQVQSRDLIEYGLIPELVGRLSPVATDFVDEELLVRILKDSRDSPVRLAQKWLAYDGINLRFTDDSLRLIAKAALKQNLGARPLANVVDRLTRSLAFEAPDLNPEQNKTVRFDKDLTSQKLAELRLL